MRAIVVSLMVALAGCQAAPEIGALCTRASDCTGGLVCSRGRCRVACAISDDCGPLARCLVDPENGVGTCSLDVDGCRTHDCPVGFLCRDGECTNACDTVVRCPDGVCEGGACVAVHGDAGVRPDAATPTDASLPRASGLYALGSHFCVISPAAELWCWGASDHYELGDREIGHGDCAHCSATPVRALASPSVPLAQVSAVTGSHGFTCALVAGDVLCWGSGPLGVMGPSASIVDPQLAVDHASVPGVTSMSAGVEHVCVLAAAVPWCWGLGLDGRLGDGTTHDATTPVRATALVASASPASITALVAARHHTQVLTSDARVLGVGNDDSFELGGRVGGTTTTPLVAPTTTARAIASEGGTTCALEADGRVACWGAAIIYVSGSLLCPDGTCAETPTYVDPPAGETILGIAVSRFALCVWTDAGRAHCIGDPSLADSHVALAPVRGVANVVEIVAGELAMCARTADGGVSCWGSNDAGQLGRGTHDDGDFPAAASVMLPF